MVLIYKYFLKALISILWDIYLRVVLLNHVLVLLLLLNIMSFKFIYVFVYISIFYFYVVLYRMNIPHNLVTDSTVDGHLSCFLFGTTTVLI